MENNCSALYSEYLIDGVPQDLTPADLLAECLAPGAAVPPLEGEIGLIIDETADPDAMPAGLESSRLEEYMDLVRKAVGIFPPAFAESSTKLRISKALIDCIWKKGNFRLGDLSVSLSWKWDDSVIGNMAAFYLSVKAAAEFLDAVGVKLDSYSFGEADACSFDVSVRISEDAVPGEDDLLFGENPFSTGNPVMEEERALPPTMSPDASGWIIYIPFETSSYRMGGSLLMEGLGCRGTTAPSLDDPDYFLDCYEVVRELVEDRILLSGSTVAMGGLGLAADRMMQDNVSFKADLCDLIKDGDIEGPVKALFAEVPGVIVQIPDSDFDYVDAELLLQDVAYYPLGHPREGKGELGFKASSKPAIQSILESLIGGTSGIALTD